MLALGICSVIAVTGCAAGSDSVATGGGTFDFVSPGGQTDIFYDPPEARGQIGALSGPDLMAEDKVVSVADYAGQVVVINLWGQWCGPCRAEADDLERVYAATKDMGVQFLGINVRDPQRDKAQDFVIDYKVGYPSIYDPSMRTLIALGGSYPTRSNDQNLWIPGGRAFPEDDRRSHRILIKTSVGALAGRHARAHGSTRR
ncbi:TlpA disulfide reductase family protein, partial [Nocardia farcinica]|uniref:TlpA disulfide reductase family protein n=1 Tax=Nocardia farcinica TaxID=37329 RepID=UPI0024545988